MSFLFGTLVGFWIGSIVAAAWIFAAMKEDE